MGSFDTAAPITAGQFNDSVSLGNDDYFKFSLASRSAIALTLSGSADAYLYDSNQSQIRASTNPSSSTDLINTMLEAGLYYIRVTGSGNYSAGFQLQSTSQQNALLWRQPSSGTNAVWYMTGTQVASVSFLNAVDDSWLSLSPALQQHQRGRGSRLCQVAKERGIDFTVARLWVGDRSLERQLKRRKGSPRLCPICSQ